MSDPFDNMIHIQICEEYDCDRCEELVTHGLVWSCDDCNGLGNSLFKNEGYEGEVLCDPCYDKFKEDRIKKDNKK